MTLLVAGLGNPGERYARTRHNAGWMLAERLAVLAGATAWREGFGGLVAEAAWGPKRLLLLRPLTFMNLSGQAVKAGMAALDIGPANVVVALDEVQLPVGRLKLSTGGSDGGHNGLKSVDASLGSQGYRRLRIGVGPHPRGEMADFVLSEFAEADLPLLAETLDFAAACLLEWARGGADERGYPGLVAKANARTDQPLDRLLAKRAAEAATLPGPAEPPTGGQT